MGRIEGLLALMVKLETVCVVLMVVSLQCHLYKAGGEPVRKHKTKADSGQLLDSLTSERNFNQFKYISETKSYVNP